MDMDHRQRVDLLLGLSEEAWRELPRIEAEIDGWDLLDQLDVTENWALEEMRLNRLERCKEEGAMDAEQLVRFEKLKNLVANNRWVIERIMSG